MIADHGGTQGADVLHTMPLLAGVPDAIIQAVRARGTCLDVAAGEQVIRRWDADR